MCLCAVHWKHGGGSTKQPSGDCRSYAHCSRTSVLFKLAHTVGQISIPVVTILVLSHNGKSHGKGTEKVFLLVVMDTKKQCSRMSCMYDA